MVQSDFREIHDDLLNWYDNNARSLPWRNIGNPYLVWISEVMLQQTQVQTVIPYFNSWVRIFPDVLALSDATEEDVLKQWEGLGYYSRARNIKKSADLIVNQYGGNIPRDEKQLRRLPGIGEYIAAAIASIAFGKNVPALESNGFRVISRLLDFHGEIQLSGSKKILKEFLGEIILDSKAGSINQSVMDLGSMICIPANPTCENCPVSKHCRALKNNTHLQLPVKKKKKTIPHVIVVAAVIKEGNRVLITKRMPDKLLGGLWEFPGGKVESGETHQEALARELKEEVGIEASITDQLKSYDHAYTHFSVTVFTYNAAIIAGKLQKIEIADYMWADIDSLGEVPMGKVDRMISRDLLAD